MHILSILNELSATNSPIKKVEILEAHKDVDQLQRVLQMANSNLINFYIRKVPEDYVAAGMQDLVWGLDQLRVLQSREKTGHAGIKHLQYILNTVGVDDAEVISRIITKDLKCGTGTGVCNKVFDNLIPDLPMMLAMPMKDKCIAKIKYPGIAQLKADGARCIAIYQAHQTEFFSRNFKPYFDLDLIANQILLCLGDEAMVIDGELVCFNDDGTPMDRKKSNGIINKAGKGTMSPEEAAAVRYIVWDIIPLSDYFGDGCKTPYAKRFEFVKETFDWNGTPDSANARVIPIESHIVNSLDEAKSIFRQYVAEGLEGIILKNANAPWENRRSNNQVKFKMEFVSDLIITDCYEGTGKYAGMLGGFTVESGDGLLEVNVGSGFDDEQREKYWHIRNELVGMVVEVKHNGKIKSKGKKLWSVFLPIFLCIRDDKDAADATTLDLIDG